MDDERMVVNMRSLQKTFMVDFVEVVAFVKVSGRRVDLGVEL
jgi:hypothetical protein